MMREPHPWWRASWSDYWRWALIRNLRLKMGMPPHTPPQFECQMASHCLGGSSGPLVKIGRKLWPQNECAANRALAELADNWCDSRSL